MLTVLDTLTTSGTICLSFQLHCGFFRGCLSISLLLRTLCTWLVLTYWLLTYEFLAFNLHLAFKKHFNFHL